MRESIIVALDTDAHTALSLARTLQGRAKWVKVGMTLYYAEGPQIVGLLRDMGFHVFLDLKLHDIPHQVEGAARQIARLGVSMMTVHASGGSEMMKAAVRGAREGAEVVGMAVLDVIAVTVLTSLGDGGLSEIGVHLPAAEQVEHLGALARDAGVSGVVCSPLEAASMRKMLGPDALIVTPGVRPSGSDVGDQSRVATPRAALEAGASHLVIGRPITADPEPGAAFERIVEQG
ncbi:MAG: orotidine-5'-phosphate decarboxylase [Actinobacteria bacterium HGW-Actinobacteria-10]|jgi:orotidine-5'-phosphate decarboxylase|nr:MAG: orotidine-5'-phosphate decarboxylase [Actinobacteria bacterium HGW-Actinobacteria-10]